ncbi:MAG: SPOR domain-containing protein [Gemmatimonadota bacterium]|nr:SPOR domain-containing protein [Gemmatimonadota bacterium]MDQ8168149.1 SPOR domain-containing protein [Gemmatimonadota bacterium]
MRTLIASALVLLACGVTGGCADRSSRPAGADATPSIPGGPDPIVLRVSRDGGFLTAARYPALDSTIWRSSARVPALARIIAFGAEDGYLAAVDTGGAPVRIDLRLGAVTTSRTDEVALTSSADGGAIYALTRRGEITRYTPSGGDWRFTPSLPAQALYAQSDGSLIVAGSTGDRAIVWRVRPPGQNVTDSLSFDIGGSDATLRSSLGATAGAVGDRVFFSGNEMVIAVRTRDLAKALEVDVGDPVTAIAATPSGDRLFVALDNEEKLRIVDRFEEGVSGTIKLPGVPRALRMDPLGRVVLARGGGDSVYVIGLGSDAVLGVVRSAWRGDLPLVLPDGAIATARGNDVVLAHPVSLADMRTVVGGAAQFWYTMRWNGFRPRAAGLDQPVQFRTSAPRDSVDYADSAAARGPQVDTARATLRTDSASATAFTVSFAAVLDERQARQVAARIRVDGESPRITTSDRAGKTLYRVVLGPYTTRADADRVGKASGQSYWIFEGAP